jgi:DUF971 family protein
MGFFGSEGGEDGGIMNTIMFISVFVVVFSVLLGYASPILFQTSAEEPTGGPDGFDAATYTMTTFFETKTAGYSYSVESEDWGTYINIPQTYLGEQAGLYDETDAYELFGFDNGDGIWIYVYFIDDFDDEGDAIVLFAHTGWWDAHSQIIRKSDVVVHTNKDNIAAIPVKVGGSYTLYLRFLDGHTPQSSLDWHYNFHVAMGQTAIDAATDSSGFWTVITGLLTFNLPNGGTGIAIFDLVLSTAFISCCSYILFWAATRIF